MNDLLPALGSFVLRVTLLVGVSVVMALFLERRRGLLASSVLSATTIGLLLLPLVVTFVPGIPVPIEVASSWRAARLATSEAADAVEQSVTHRSRPAHGATQSASAVAGIGSVTDRAGRAPGFGSTASAATNPAETRAVFGTSAVLLSVYVAGVIFLSIRLVSSLRHVRRLRREAMPVGGGWKARLAHWRQCLGVHGTVRIIQSEHVSVPMTVGWRQPVILLPASLEHAGPEHRDAILLHELAHIRRQDYFHLLLLHVAQIVYWWHPLVWIVALVSRQLRERACDELCVHWIGDQSRYCESLIEIARQTICRPRLALGLAMAHTSHLSRRVAHLRRTVGNEQCVPRGPVGYIVFGMVTLAVLLVGLITFDPQRATAEPPEGGGGVVRPLQARQPAEKGRPAAPQGEEAANPNPRRETDVGLLLNRLDELRPNGGEDAWAEVLRDLIELGPSAVPELIAEMDATSNEYMLRCLGFVLRGIGDKRAIPALIRTLPKTCVRPGSDMGYIAKDPELLAFMQEHDMEAGEGGGTHYSFGRAINEYRVTLQKLTGTSQGEEQLVHVFLQGTPRQQALQRQLYQRCAKRWADWWELHWKEFVVDERDARIDLASLDSEITAVNTFPHGPNAKIDARHGNHILESIRNTKARAIFLDLDTGRSGALPEHLKLAGGQPKRLDDVLAWAAREGFDLMGMEYTPPKSEKSHYVLRGLGLNAWQVETEMWGRLERELAQPEPLKMGPRIEGLLAQFDEKTGQYKAEQTATFLFQTREGGFGAIFVGVEVHDDRQAAGGAVGANDELNPVAFSKGRRFAYTLISADAPNGSSK